MRLTEYATLLALTIILAVAALFTIGYRTSRIFTQVVNSSQFSESEITRK